MSDPLEAKVVLAEAMHFQAGTGSGHTLSLDAAEESGGHDGGPRPMELLLVGLGGCTAMDVISILRKMQQHVTGYEVAVRGERAADHPKVFTEIAVEHRVRGIDLAADRVRRAVMLSAEKYCSASAMLSKAAHVRHDYVVLDDRTGAELSRGSLEE